MRIIEQEKYLFKETIDALNMAQSQKPYPSSADYEYRKELVKYHRSHYLGQYILIGLNTSLYLSCPYLAKILVKTTGNDYIYNGRVRNVRDETWRMDERLLMYFEEHDYKFYDEESEEWRYVCPMVIPHGVDWTVSSHECDCAEYVLERHREWHPPMNEEGKYEPI